MPVHLYCLLSTTESSGVPAPPLGIAGAPVRVLRAGAVDAWVSDLPRSAAVATAADALAHHAVAQAALDAGFSPLPARFGQRFASAAECVAALEARAERLAATLERVRGMVEMAVVARLASAGSPPSHAARTEPRTEPLTGREYLERARARLRGDDAADAAALAVAEAFRGQVAAALGGLAREQSFQIDRAPTPARASITHLVPRDGVGAYRRALEPLLAQGGDGVLLAGPRPAYHLAEADFVAVRSSRETA